MTEQSIIFGAYTRGPKVGGILRAVIVFSGLGFTAGMLIKSIVQPRFAVAIGVLCFVLLCRWAWRDRCVFLQISESGVLVRNGVGKTREVRFEQIIQAVFYPKRGDWAIYYMSNGFRTSLGIPYWYPHHQELMDYLKTQAIEVGEMWDASP